MIDQFGNDVGPGYIGSSGQTVTQPVYGNNDNSTPVDASKYDQSQLDSIRQFSQANWSDPGAVAAAMQKYNVDANMFSAANAGHNGLTNKDVQDYVARIGSQTGNGSNFAGNTSNLQGMYDQWGGGGQSTVNSKPMAIGGAASGGTKTGGSGTGSGSGAGGAGLTQFSGGYSPWTVTGNQTVAGNINTLTDPNSPLIQQARTRALEGMSGRGLTNSSMASTAADDAAYNAALPIATSDAATFAKAAGYNADQLNQLNLQANSLNSAQNIAQLQANTSLATTDKNNASSQAIAQMNNASSQAIARLNSDTQLQVQGLQNQYGTVINSNSQAAAAFNNYAQQMAAIDANANMDANTKTQAKANLSHIYQQQLATLASTSGLNLTSGLNFSNYPGFDSNGNFVGFNSDGSTKGSTPGASTNTETTKPATA